MKLWNINICVTSPKSILVIFVILLSSIVIAGVWPAGIIEVDVKEQDIVYILDRLDYDDGSWDSIRYVEGGEVDQRLTNKRENR